MVTTVYTLSTLYRVSGHAMLGSDLGLSSVEVDQFRVAAVAMQSMAFAEGHGGFEVAHSQIQFPLDIHGLRGFWNRR